MKQTIKLKESQLRRMIMKALNEKLCLTEDILIGKGGGYYGGSPIFRVCVENGNGTEYLFSPPGWDFETQSQLEAAAICCHSNKSFLSELLNSPELNQLPVAMPSDNDKIEALYWLTGGNAEWDHGYWAEHRCEWNDETIKLLMGDSDIIGMLDKAVSGSNSFAELVSHLREGEYMLYANDILPLQYDDEEGVQEQLQESKKLRAIIKEGIKKVLSESERHEIFTLDIFDIENENGIDDMQYARDYESEDEAIQAAREVAQKYADMDTVINVFVMAGEYMDAQGNVLGEPDAIYCVSNKDRETTMQARTNAGYCNPEASEYVGEGQIGDSSKVSGVTNESKLRAIIKEGIQKVLNEEYGVDIQDTLAWVQRKHPDMSPEEQERFAKNIIKKREHDNYVFDMHMATSGGNDSFKRELTWDEAKRYYMKYGRYIDEIFYKDKRYGPYTEWTEFNPKAFFDEDGE